MSRWKSIIKFITEKLLLLSMIFIHFQVYCEDLTLGKTCGNIMDTPGWTFPSGDIPVLYGNSLEIYCNLNLNHHYANGRNASHLFFRRGGNLISEEYVTILNETTARMFIRKPPLSTNVYYCFLNTTMFNNNIAIDSSRSSLEMDNRFEETTNKCLEKDISGCENEVFVCMNTVSVAVPPQPIQNFTCVSYEWERLVCTWKTPNNYILTKYKVYYKVSYGSRRHECPNDDDERQNRCEWSSITKPAYRKAFKFLNFEIEGKNIFGQVNTAIKFYNYAHVIPPVPKNFSVVQKTISSVYVNFSIGSTMPTFEGGLTFKITYKWRSSSNWTTILYGDVNNDTRLNKDSVVYINITDLPYPNVLYDIRLYVKSAVAADEPNLWSNFSSLIVKTNACAPFVAPKTDMGSFEIFQQFTDYSKVNLYWQQIPALNSNGDGLKYRVYKVYVDGIEKNIDAIENNHQSYLVYNISNLYTYQFFIISENNIGPSQNYSELTIPSISYRVQEVSEFAKLHIERGIYELSWKISEKHDNVHNFTIFWCESNLERPIQCDGLLNWIHVGANITSVNVTTSNPNNGYQFAISANTDRYSSGMKWAPCTIRRVEVSKIKNLWINKADSHTIEIGWKLDCSDLVEGIKGYRVYFCPMVSPELLKCKEEEKSTDILGDAYKMRGTVGNLKPFTIYKLSVAIFTFDGTVGPRSDNVFNHTLEAAPTLTNCKVKIINITNTSVSLLWDKPVSMNGVFQYYKVEFNYENIHPIPIISNDTIATIGRLRSYTNYNISVYACTKACSKYNETLNVTTKIGIPREVERPAVYKNKSFVSVVWKPLSTKFGPNIRYDVWYYEDPSTAISNKLYMKNNITGNNVNVVISECQDESNVHFIFRVRAKSYNEDYSEMYNGPWSDQAGYDCGVQSVSLILQVTIYLTLVICIFISTFWGKKFFFKCVKMKNVVVTMPPTFAVPQLLHQGEQELTQTWSKHNPDVVRLDAPSDTHDEQLLLDTKQKKSNFEDEHLLYSEQCSSGFYSGENSATSSVNGAANQSSDSGAEMDSKLTGSSYREEGSLHSHSRYSSFGSDEAPSDQWTDKPYVAITRNVNDDDNDNDNDDDNEASVTWSDTYTICSDSNFDCATPPATISSNYVPLGIISSNLTTQEQMDTIEKEKEKDKEKNYISWPISTSCCDISYDEILSDLPIGYSRATPWTSDEAIDGKKKSSSSSCIRSDYVTLPANTRAIIINNNNNNININNNTNYVVN